MDKTALVEHDIQVGGRVTECLEKSGIPIVGTFWFYERDAAEWRLRVVTPLVDTKGPRVTYTTIRKTLEKLDPSLDFPIHRITVVSPKDSLIRGLRKAIRTRNGGTSGVRFIHDWVNKHYIEEAYIYRLR